MSFMHAFVFYALACVHVCFSMCVQVCVCVCVCVLVCKGEGQASVCSVAPQEPSILFFLFLR